MTRPLIGITTYGRDAAGRFSLPVEYVASIQRAGARPALLAPFDHDLKRLTAGLDGVILSGGGDLDPALYGGASHPCVYLTDRHRDDYEMALVREALQRDLPLFGICRGAQLINVALGGTLFPHLPDVVGDSLLHRQAKPAPLPDDPNPTMPATHLVSVVAETRLSRILGCETCPVSSWHHQAINRLGDGLRVSATAADGIVEAVELPGARWLLAVQWHPEITAATAPRQQLLFDRFVAAL